MANPSYRTLRLLVGLLFLLNGIDALTTAYLVEMDGPEIESNPFMRFIIESYGATGMVLYKFASIFVLFACLMWMKFKNKSLALALVGVYLCISVYSVISVANLTLVYVF